MTYSHDNKLEAAKALSQIERTVGVLFANLDKKEASQSQTIRALDLAEPSKSRNSPFSKASDPRQSAKTQTPAEDVKPRNPAAGG
jgi:hypothetical protein